VLAKGYAFASTDKGNVGTAFYTDGQRPGDAVTEWHHRMTQLTRAAKASLAQHYGSKPRRTYVTGISNGGYLARWQLENRPGLYDGGVDWEGTLFAGDAPNLFTFLPPALRHYPKAAAGDEAAHQAMLDAGYAPGSEPLWVFHYTYYWDLTQRIYREEFDPGYDGETQAGYPFCLPGSVPGCDTDYDYASRPDAVHDAVERVSLTGNVSKPMITLHGTLDTLLPISVDSDVYAELGTKPRFRYYRIEGGNHVDGLYPVHPQLLRPMLPCYRDAFTALERWVDRRVSPPASRTIPRPTDGDLVNTCGL
ncbi:MAG: tannase/feruloyl esterase family alpha/beta hydrolase, partial [Micromonosporaceae bacterium]